LHATGYNSDGGAGKREFSGGQGHYAFGSGGIEAGGFAFDPGAEAGEHRVGVEGEVLAGSIGASRGEITAAAENAGKAQFFGWFEMGLSHTDRV